MDEWLRKRHHSPNYKTLNYQHDIKAVKKVEGKTSYMMLI